MHSVNCQECLKSGRFKDDWCHAGGISNWAKIGVITDHENYGYPHVVYAGTTNCAFCGKEYGIHR